MNNNVILSALAMDLKRVALGLNRKSYRMADRFFLEAIKRKKGLNNHNIASYVRRIIGQLDQLSDNKNTRRAEDALMYSTLIQNYILYK